MDYGKEVSYIVVIKSAYIYSSYLRGLYVQTTQQMNIIAKDDTVTFESFGDMKDYDRKKQSTLKKCSAWAFVWLSHRRSEQNTATIALALMQSDSDWKFSSPSTWTEFLWSTTF